MQKVKIRHGHLFAGLGGGAKGFNQGEARIGNLEAEFECVGGIDCDGPAIEDFKRLSGARGTVLDLFSREQYIEFHGHEPPAGWVEATPEDIRAAMGGIRPNIWFTSPPCKGFSGLLSQVKSGTAKYQALNALTLRGIWLLLNAWPDDPAEFILLENVPRIQNRGRVLLDRIVGMLRAHGYACAETTHDCGELGNLAQSRKRFLLVARHVDKVRPFLYEPIKRPLRAVGDVLGTLPMPGDTGAGAMHRLPALQWKTWVRLAFVEAGSDWRSLNKLEVVDGALRDYLIMPELFNGAYGVTGWNESGATVTSKRQPSCGQHAVADPRFPAGGEYGQLGVRGWDQPTGTVTGQRSPIQGGFSVADPRMVDSPMRQNGIYRVVRWERESGAVTGAAHVAGAALSIADPRTGYSPASHRNKFAVVGWDKGAGTVTGSHQVQGGALSVADPRCPQRDDYKSTKYRVTGWDEFSGSVIGASSSGNGAFCVADPRAGLDRAKGSHYLTAGHYGVVPWGSPAYAVTGRGRQDNGHNSVADPRLPIATERMVAVIRAIDGTWHRPFTTLELAALQGLVDAESHLELEGLSDSAWRERIGNAVPAPAAAAIAGVMGRAILAQITGETFKLSAEPVWVRDVAIAIQAAT